MSVGSEIIRLEDMQVCYATDGDPVLAVDGVDLAIERGEIVGIIGESGSGKTSLVRAMAGLLGRNSEVMSGRVIFDGELVYSGVHDARAKLRGSRIGVVFQDARASLDSVMTVGAQVSEVLRTHRDISKRQAREAVVTLLGRLGFDDPQRVYDSYPFQLSGGMCQRAAIAAAVVAEPELLIADECTSALDVTRQAEVAALFSNIAREASLTLLFVTHDILFAAQWCSRLVVMYAGQVVEDGIAEAVVRRPRHPYTKALIDAVPLWESRRQLASIAGSPPSVHVGAVGCRFFARCPRAVNACAAADVEWTRADNRHGFRCTRPVEVCREVR